MFSLITVFSLMMFPAFATLVVSFVVSVFENKSHTITACDTASLTEASMANISTCL